MKAWTLVIIILVFVLLVASLVIVSLGWSLDKKDYKYKYLVIKESCDTMKTRVSKRDKIFSDIKMANTFKDFRKIKLLITDWETILSFEKEQK